MTNDGRPTPPDVMAGALDVYRHHGAQTAAAFADIEEHTLYQGARAAGVTLGPPGRPADMTRTLPRADCPCPMCRRADHSPLAARRRADALRSIMVEPYQKTPVADTGDDGDDWFDRAACRKVPRAGQLMFSSDGADRTRAIAICSGCPVRQACGDYATRNGIAYGVWGGVSIDATRRARTAQEQRRRARRRADERRRNAA